MYTEQFIVPFEKENPDIKWADVEVSTGVVLRLLLNEICCRLAMVKAFIIINFCCHNRKEISVFFRICCLFKSFSVCSEFSVITTNTKKSNITVM